MISITSIISFAVVLLAASSYSAPIDKQPDSSTFPVIKPNAQSVAGKQEFTNESTSMSTDHKDRSSEEKDSDEMTTEGVTRPSREVQSQESGEFTTEHVIHQSRTNEGKDSEEMTTDAFTRPSRGFESKESDEMTTDAFTRPPREFVSKDSEEMTTDAFTHPPREFVSKDSEEMTTEVFTQSPREFVNKDSEEITTDAFTRPPREFEVKDSNEMTTDVFTQSPRGLKEDTIPSSTEEFPFTTLESSTQFNQRAVPSFKSEEEIDSSSPSSFPSNKKKSISEEPTSSIQSFGKSTGLLQDKPKDQSSEQYEKYSQYTTPMLNYPSESSESKVDTKVPSKKTVIPPVEQEEQLSQVQPQSNVDKKKSDN